MSLCRRAEVHIARPVVSRRSLVVVANRGELLVPRTCAFGTPAMVQRINQTGWIFGLGVEHEAGVDTESGEGAFGSANRPPNLDSGIRPLGSGRRRAAATTVSRGQIAPGARQDRVVFGRLSGRRQRHVLVNAVCRYVVFFTAETEGQRTLRRLNSGCIRAYGVTFMGSDGAATSREPAAVFP